MLSHGGERKGIVALGEPLPVFIDDERVVEKSRLHEAQKSLEDPVDVGRGDKILAAGDMGDFLGGIVDNDGEMIGRADVFSGQNDIAEEGRLNGNGAMTMIMEGERSRKLGRLLGIQTPGGLTLLGEFPDLVVGKVSAGPGIERAFRAVGSPGEMGKLLFDLTTGTEAGIDDFELL